MKNITYISASAGSGKTYRLTEELANVLSDKNVAPESVILTTFTTKAADEFREKAKAKLYEKGMHNQAERLAHAMIGTVHSVSNSFIQKYWYLLGLSPNPNVLNDNDVEFFRNQSLADLPTEEELSFLKRIARQFDIRYSYTSGKYGINYDFWKNDLSQIIDAAKNFDIASFSQSKEYSKNLVKSLYPGTKKVSIDYENIFALANEFDIINQNQKPSATKDTRQKKINDFKAEINRNKNDEIYLMLSTYKFLENFTQKFFDIELKQNIADQISGLWESEIIQKVQLEYVDLIFELSERYQKKYQEYKKEKHLIDYTDMETFMYELLKRKDVQDDISKTYRFLFVDEFQDSSPLQIKIFDALSNLVEKSVWVGDYKQAIYGFRGADTDLTKALTDIISSGENNCHIAPPLSTSWRSLPPIVELCNETFKPVFSDILKPEQIELNCCEEKKKQFENKKQDCLKLWALDGSNADLRTEELASNIAAMVKNGEEPKNIAVLAKRKEELKNLAALLKQYNLPILREESNDIESKEVVLLTALLSLVVNENDTMARAKIAFLSERGFDAARILDERFINIDSENLNDGNYLDDVPLIASLIEKREKYKSMSVAGLVEALIIEMDLYNIAKRWKSNENSSQILHAIIDTAKNYEEHCIQMGLPSTVYGFISFIDDNSIQTAGDENGIRLFTFHGSKGLEWKNVILMSLDKNPIEDGDLILKDFYGVQKFHEIFPNKNELYPPMTISVLPWIFGSKKTVPDEILTKIYDCERFSKIKENVLAESKRIMYVAMTRPSEHLVLTSGKKNSFAWFNAMGLTTQEITDEKFQDVLGIGVLFKLENFENVENWKFKTEDKTVINLKNQTKKYKPRDMQPSSFKTEKKISARIVNKAWGRIPLKASDDEMDKTGTCIHDIFCAIENNPTENFVNSIIKAHEMERELPEPKSILDAWNNFSKWLEETYGKGKSYHEIPFKHFYDGQIFTGSIDFVWETKNGVVLVDYKTYPGKKDDVINPAHEHFAGMYAGQFECYERALNTAEKKVTSKLIYYATLGIVVELSELTENQEG